jgi:hypothetical protein
VADTLIRRRVRRIALWGAALHVLFLSAAPLEHHDLVCHLKTPQHCSTCAFSPVGSQLPAGASAGAALFADAGRAVTVYARAEGAVPAAPHSGRSPPSTGHA